MERGNAVVSNPTASGGKYWLLKSVIIAGISIIVVSTLCLLFLVGASNYVETTVSGIKVGVAKEDDVDKVLWILRKAPSDTASLPEEYLEGLQRQGTAVTKVVSYQLVAYDAYVIFDPSGTVVAIYVD